jgi:hypothetical protein
MLVKDNGAVNLHEDVGSVPPKSLRIYLSAYETRRCYNPEDHHQVLLLLQAPDASHCYFRNMNYVSASVTG